MSMDMRIIRDTTSRWKRQSRKLSIFLTFYTFKSFYLHKQIFIFHLHFKNFLTLISFYPQILMEKQFFLRHTWNPRPISVLILNISLQEAVPGIRKKGRKDMLKSIMDSVMKVVESELKSILNKDINKKLCESYAFLLFDKWWTEQETKYKREQELEFKKKAGTSGTTALLPDREKVFFFNF